MAMAIRTVPMEREARAEQEARAQREDRAEREERAQPEAPLVRQEALPMTLALACGSRRIRLPRKAGANTIERFPFSLRSCERG